MCSVGAVHLRLVITVIACHCHFVDVPFLQYRWDTPLCKRYSCSGYHVCELLSISKSYLSLNHVVCTCLNFCTKICVFTSLYMYTQSSYIFLHLPAEYCMCLCSGMNSWHCSNLPVHWPFICDVMRMSPCWRLIWLPFSENGFRKYVGWCDSPRALPDVLSAVGVEENDLSLAFPSRGGTSVRHYDGSRAVIWIINRIYLTRLQPRKDLPGRPWPWQEVIRQGRLISDRP